MKNKSEELKLMFIKTKEKIFVSDNVAGNSYFHTKLAHLYFDGELPAKTFKSDWFELKSIPIELTRKVPEREINHRYELKEGFVVTELTPQTIHERYIDEDSEYYEVKGLYTRQYETEDAGFEVVPFEIHLVEEVEGNFEITRSQYNPQYGLLDKIQTHPNLLQLKPCKLTKEETYKIIREHIKLNINPKYARISSDYDFCLTVEKVIERFEPESYTVDLNAMCPRRKPKLETRYRTSRKARVYEAAPKSYQKYPIVENFVGESLQDLDNNIKIFLHKLMDKINEPVVDCEHCKGRGVITNGN